MSTRIDPSPADVARFRARVTEGPPEACWPYQGGYTQRAGHKQFALHGRMTGAHRVAYVIANGPIPDGQVVRHDCDNPPCCNPAHLRLGSIADNNTDRHSRGRTAMPRPEQVFRMRRQPTKHGTLTGYVKHECRCEACCAANSAYRSRRVICPDCGNSVASTNLARHRRSQHAALERADWPDPTDASEDGSPHGPAAAERSGAAGRGRGVA